MSRPVNYDAIDKIIRVNDELLDHISTCDRECHVKRILEKALSEDGK